MMLRDRLLPWSGFVLGAIGWSVSGQWGAYRVSDACLQAWTLETAALGLAGLLLVLAGAWLSWLANRETALAAVRFVARLSLASDLIFGVAILFHTAASLIIPRCFS